jgi:hypothetical protein
MDHIIRLDLPDPFYRLRALLLYTSLYLSLYLSSAQREVLEQLHQCTLVPSKASAGEAILPSHSADEIIEKLEARLQGKVSLHSAPLTASKKESPTPSATSANSNKKKPRKPAPRPADAPMDISPEGEDPVSAKVRPTVAPQTHSPQAHNGPHEDGLLSLSDGAGEVLDLVWCVGVSLLHSDGWSYREFEKFFKGILAAVLSTERSVSSSPSRPPSLLLLTCRSCLLTTQIWSDQIRFKKAHVHHPGKLQARPSSAPSAPPPGSPSR